jgi:transcriptional regulator with XRE-family HTH domain
MDIGHRITSLREEKKLSQGDIEKRTGLLRCYISRVENGHTVPAIETLEKIARALEMPLYQMMYDGQEPPKLPTKTNGHKAREWGEVGKDARFLNKLARFLAAMNEADRQLLLSFAENVTRRRKRTAAPRTKAL